MYDDYFDGEEQMDQPPSEGEAVRGAETTVVTFVPGVGGISLDALRALTVGVSAGFLLVVTGIAMWWQAVGAIGLTVVARRLERAVSRSGPLSYLTGDGVIWFLAGGTLGVAAGTVVRITLFWFGGG